MGVPTMPPRAAFTLDGWRAVGQYGRDDVKEQIMRPTAGHNLTHENIQKVWTALSRLAPAGHQLMVSAITRTGQALEGKWSKPGGVTPLSFTRYEGYTESWGMVALPVGDRIADHDITAVHFWMRPAAGGGASPLNDCLFECILAYFTRYNRPMQGPLCAAGLKTLLGLARDAPVPVELLKKVEEAYKVCITVEGEAKYGEVPATKKNYIRLALKQSHYYDPEKKPATCILWKKNGGDKVLAVSSGSKGKVFETSWPWLCERLRMKGDYACLKAGPLGGNRGASLEDQYAAWQKEYKALLPHGVDLHLTPTYGAAARRELALTAKMLDWQPLPVDQQKWVKLAHPGGHVWQKRGFEGKATRYDYNSHHPSLLAKCTFPKGPGVWHTLKGKVEAKDGSKNWNLGIYRLATHLPEQDPTTCPLWTEKKTPYYTHYDLRAYEAASGKEAVLAQDGKPNALLWPARTHIADGRSVFKALVDKWYALKQKKVPGAGKLLKAMCGALSSRSKKWSHITPTDQLPTLNILRGTRRADGTHDIEYQPGDDIYSGAAPAVNCFVAAQGRYELCAQLRGLKDVVSVLTDSFTVQTPLAANDPRLGAGLGQLKQEKQGTFKVTGMCTGVWN